MEEKQFGCQLRSHCRTYMKESGGLSTSTRSVGRQVERLLAEVAGMRDELRSKGGYSRTSAKELERRIEALAAGGALQPG